MEKVINVTLAGLTIPCMLHYADSAKYFPPPNPDVSCIGIDPVCLSDEDWDRLPEFGMFPCAHSEYSILTGSFSDALLSYDRMILHAAAIRWNGKAYLITAPSGVGKSTQVRTLQELRPGEFDVICGDRPVLEFQAPVQTDKEAQLQEVQVKGPTSDGEVKTIQLKLPVKVPWKVIVHPSPWNGKENWHGAPAAPLGGLILLERGPENSLVPISAQDASLRVFTQIIQTWKFEPQIKKSAELATHLLESVPIWRLITCQVPDSTKLLLETLFSTKSKTDREAQP